MNLIKNINLLPILSLCGQLLFIGIVIVLHFLRTDTDPLINFVSEYAVGDYDWLMTIAFFSNATGQVCLLFALLNITKATKTSIATFSIWCIGSILFSIFKTDIPGQTVTFTGLVLHGIAALIAFLFLAISMIAWAKVFKQNANWSKMAKISKPFGILSLVLFFVFLFSPIWCRGLTERILIAWDFTWLLLITMHLLGIKTRAK